MPNYTLTYSFDHVPPVLTRNRHALIVVKDAQGKYILGGKRMYPENIYRFVGGGIDSHEDPLQGAARELHEELGIQPLPNQLKEIALISARIRETSSNNEYHFSTHLFKINLTQENAHLIPGDDLDTLVAYSASQLNELISRFRSLPNNLITVGAKSPSQPFRWSDYGAFYAKVHEIGLKLTSE